MLRNFCASFQGFEVSEALIYITLRQMVPQQPQLGSGGMPPVPPSFLMSGEKNKKPPCGVDISKAARYGVVCHSKIVLRIP